MSESKRPKGKYKKINWASYNAALKSLTSGERMYPTYSRKNGRK